MTFCSISVRKLAKTSANWMTARELINLMAMASYVSLRSYHNNYLGFFNISVLVSENKKIYRRIMYFYLERREDDLQNLAPRERKVRGQRNHGHKMEPQIYGQ
jgi:hypothetical protein